MTDTKKLREGIERVGTADTGLLNIPLYNVEVTEALMREAADEIEALRCVVSAMPASVLSERKRQDAKWGEQNHLAATWLVILGEEFGEVCQATLEMDWNKYREEMVQVAAVAVAAIESHDRALGSPEKPL